MTRRVVALAAALSAITATARAEVVRVVVDRRDTIPYGYERLVGRIYFAFDPANPWNAAVADLELAPRNAQGRVEAWSDFVVLRPRDPRRASGVVLFEVPNRGTTHAIRHFNRAATGFTAERLSDFGDGFLMRRGITIVWVGWQFDVPREPGRLRLSAPVATDHGRPITGLVRSDWRVLEAARALAIGSRGHIPYSVADPASPDNVLTVRDSGLGARRIVARDRWRFAGDSITLAGGFEVGRIYELVYRARDPVVAGLGLAALRDAAAYARHDSTSLFPARIGIAFGVSQSGRLLRQFLHDEFNTDERGRPAFDGLIVQVAGAGRGSFNHRFAQPSRAGTVANEFFYPIDLPPFTGREVFRRARRPGNLPKVFFCNTGYEYWGRAASLIHSTPDGRADVTPASNERDYHFASGQHVVGDADPLDFRFTLRALLVRMIEWVRDGREPPASRVPRIADATLVPRDQLRFPDIPGVRPPGRPYQAYRLDSATEPPQVGAPFSVLVPQVDGLGNELGGIRGVELTAPLATYTPWRLRGGTVAPDLMVDFEGGFHPLPRTDAERRRAGDPRPSITSLYADRAAYLAAVSRAARTLVTERLLLPEDILPVRLRATTTWDRLVGHP